VDYAGQSGAGGPCAHPVFKRAGLIDGAGIDRVADRLFHRQAFAGDRGLVDGRAALHNHAVERHPFTWPGPHPVADCCPADIHLGPASIRSLNGCRFRGQVQQIPDGPARPVQALGFNGFGQGEQHHDHGRFRILPDKHRPGHRHAHQGIYVQVEIFKCDPALFIGGQAAQQDGHERRNKRQPFDGGHIADSQALKIKAEKAWPPLVHQFEDFRKGGQSSRKKQPRPGCFSGGNGCRLAGFNGLGFHVNGV